MWELLYYCWSYGAYPNSLCHVLPPAPDQLPLIAVQAKIWRRHSCPSHMGQVQGVLLQEPGWLLSFCGCILGKDQEGLLAPARGSLRLNSSPGATASGPLRVWSRCHSEQGDHDPALPGRPEAFRPGQVRHPKPEPRLLGRGRRENRQCKGKGIVAILPQYSWHGVKVSPREQVYPEGREKLW